MKQLNDREIQFFGKITAGITHEMRNVLAIIRESCGLMDDILTLSKDAAFPHSEKFRNILKTIEQQILRGQDLATRLNRFAHSPDLQMTRIDLNEAAEQLVALAHRFARLRNVQMQMTSFSRPVQVETRPVQLQMALFTAIECCLHAMPAGGMITLCPQLLTEYPLVQIRCDGKDLDKASFEASVVGCEKWPIFQSVAVDLGGRAELGGTPPGISLFVPQKLSLTSPPDSSTQ